MGAFQVVAGKSIFPLQKNFFSSLACLENLSFSSNFAFDYEKITENGVTKQSYYIADAVYDSEREAKSRYLSQIALAKYEGYGKQKKNMIK